MPDAECRQIVFAEVRNSYAYGPASRWMVKKLANVKSDGTKCYSAVVRLRNLSAKGKP